MTDTSLTLIDEALERSVDTIYPNKEALRKKLLEGKPLKIYVGIDPTADYIHLGHSTNYIVLKRFHDLGHKVIVVVGDFTAMIGDPSDKTAARVKLSREEIEKNLKTFKQQIGKILNFKDPNNPVEFKFNSEWLAALTFEDAIKLASNFTVQQMIERDVFEKRLKEKKPLYVHEFFYPLMQGYDSVAMEIDIEVGGTDQTFNMLAGRTLSKRLKNKEKFVITTTLLENPATGEKLMSKSLGTGVGINDEPEDMFGKIMALPDEGVTQCFIDCTYLSMEEIKKVESELKEGINPRDIKLRLAHEIVSMYYDKNIAYKAQESWVKQFSNRQEGFVPPNALEISVSDAAKVADQPILSVVLNSGVAKSSSEARRLLDQGALKLNGKIVTSLATKVKPGDVFQIGKRHYIKLVK